MKMKLSALKKLVQYEIKNNVKSIKENSLEPEYDNTDYREYGYDNPTDKDIVNIIADEAEQIYGISSVISNKLGLVTIKPNSKVKYIINIAVENGESIIDIKNFSASGKATILKEFQKFEIFIDRLRARNIVVH